MMLRGMGDFGPTPSLFANATNPDAGTPVPITLSHWNAPTYTPSLFGGYVGPGAPVPIQTASAGSTPVTPPAATIPAATSLIPGISNTTLLIGAGAVALLMVMKK